ncbi:MAG: type II toxin-antitoxin system YafQ family toxin [Magnetococcales bacterium]|nr:type II toxin-antitoxin system YafQ family toxin [Magnetococcales bacterium]
MFDRDLKRARKRGKNINKLREIINALAAGEHLAARFRPHMFSGQWSEIWEYHMEPDRLLVWIHRSFPINIR